MRKSALSHFLDPAGYAGNRLGPRTRYQKHVIRFARAEHLQIWEKNQVRPEVVLVNSHDKSSAYQLHCGLFRLVYTNGLVVSDGTFQRISIKHFGFNPDSVIQASFELLNAVPDIMNKVQVFQDRILMDEERLAFATGAATHRLEDVTKAPVSPALLLNPRRYGDGAKDLWATLNCVQENIIRGGQRDTSRLRPDGSRMPKTRAIKGIDEDMKLKRPYGKWPKRFATVLHNRSILETGAGPTRPQTRRALILVSYPITNLAFVAIKMGHRQDARSGAYLNGYVTDEQRSRRAHFLPTLRAVASWLLFRVAGSLRINSDMLVARLEKQPTDRRRKPSYLWDRIQGPFLMGHLLRNRRAVAHAVAMTPSPLSNP